MIWLVAGLGCPRILPVYYWEVAQGVPRLVSACWWLGIGPGMSSSAGMPVAAADLPVGGTRFWC